MSIALLAAVVASACAPTAAQPAETTSGPVESSVPVESEPSGAAETSTDDAAVRRELGLVIRPESDVESNPLPSIEVDDVGQDRKVNFRNIFPAEQPVLLWMWAPF